MIKRVIGNLFAVVVVVVIVFTALGAGSYRSMISEDLFSPTVTQEQPAAPSASEPNVAVAEESAEEPQAVENEATEEATAEAESEEGQK